MSEDEWKSVLEQLVREKGESLQRTAFLLCGNVSDAEDLVHEALVRTFAKRSRDWSAPEAEAYARRAMASIHVDRIRRLGRWHGLRQLVAAPTVLPDGGQGASVERLALAKALAELSPRQRACIVLRYYEDATASEIAQALGCTVGTVKRRLSEAHVRLGVVLTAMESRTEGLTQ